MKFNENTPFTEQDYSLLKKTVKTTEENANYAKQKVDKKLEVVAEFALEEAANQISLGSGVIPEGITHVYIDISIPNTATTSSVVTYYVNDEKATNSYQSSRAIIANNYSKISCDTKITDGAINSICRGGQGNDPQPFWYGYGPQMNAGTQYIESVKLKADTSTAVFPVNTFIRVMAC